jgi:hypothetical protein
MKSAAPAKRRLPKRSFRQPATKGHLRRHKLGFKHPGSALHYSIDVSPPMFI